MPYFILRWKPLGKKKLPSGDKTIAHAYLRRQTRNLSDLERSVVELGLTQPITFYEVRVAHPGRDMLVKELFTGAEMTIEERTASRQVQTGDILYGQMAPMPGITTMAFSSGWNIRPKFKSYIVDLRREIQEIEQCTALTRQQVLNYEEDIRELYLDIMEMMFSPPRLNNTDGEPLALQTITYEVGSTQVAFDALAPLARGAEKSNLLENAKYDPEGNLSEIEIPWLKKGNRLHKSWDNTILGRIKIKGRKLVAEVNSEKRATRLREEIEKRLGLAAVYKKTQVHTTDDLLKRSASRPKAENTQDKLLENPELQQYMRDMLQKQIEGWARQKIPMLGNLTPLQAVKDPDGREIVESLVEDYRRTLESNFPARIRPDINVLRRILKIDK